jgi:hypothetical protein
MEREQIMKALECHANGCKCTQCPMPKITKEHHSCWTALSQGALTFINELTEENEKLNIDLKAMRCAANSYKIHCDKLSEEILNAFERGQKQATSHTVAKVRDRLRDMSEFNLNADNGTLYYIDLQAWMEEIESDILKEKKND